MSRRTIEEKIVKLGIDAESYKQGLKSAAQSLNALNSSMKSIDNKSFSDAEKSSTSLRDRLIDLVGKIPLLGGIANSIKPISSHAHEAGDGVSNLSDNVNQTASRFTLLQASAAVALGNIATKAVSTGAHLLKSLTIDPLRAGFQQYEEKINSVNMMVAALGEGQRTTIKETLNDLQKYAATTKYSIKDMNTNLAQFVNNGVKLDRAKTAIKGWGNLAASAGASMQGFSSSLQFGVQQALAMGKMTTQNWMSVENAGMATEKFKNLLIETGKAMGANIDMSEGFRGSLQQGWLTNDIFIASLEKLAKDPTLVKMASEFHTLSEASEAAEEAITTSWSNFWETLIGEAGSDEVTKMWTIFGNMAVDALGAAGNAATALAEQFVKFGGRSIVIKGVTRSLEDLKRAIDYIGKAWLKVFPTKFESSGKALAGIVKSIFEKMRLSEAAAKALGSIFQVVASLFKGFVAIVGIAARILEILIPDNLINNLIILAGWLASVANGFIGIFTAVGSKLGILQGVGNVLDYVSSKLTIFYDAITNSLGYIGDHITKWSTEVQKSSVTVLAFFGRFISAIYKLSPLANIIDRLTNGFKLFFHQFSNATVGIPKSHSMLQKIADVCRSLQITMDNGIIKAIANFILGLTGFATASEVAGSKASKLGESIQSVLVEPFKMVGNLVKNTGDNIKTFGKTLDKALNGIEKGKIKSYKDFFASFKNMNLEGFKLPNLFANLKFSNPFKDISFGGIDKGTDKIEKNFSSIGKFGKDGRKGFDGLSSSVAKAGESLASFGFKLQKNDKPLSSFDSKITNIGTKIGDFGVKLAYTHPKLSLISTALSKTATGFSNFGNMIGNITTDKFGEKITSVGLGISQLTNRFSNVNLEPLSRVFTQAGEHIKAYKEEVASVPISYNSFSEMFSSLGQRLKATYSNLDLLKGSMKGLGPGIRAAIPDFNAGRLSFSGLGEAAKKAKDKMSDFGSDIYNNSGPTLKAFLDILKNVGKGLSDFTKSIIDKLDLEPIFNKFSTTSGLLSKTGVALSGFVLLIRNAIASVLKSLDEFFFGTTVYADEVENKTKKTTTKVGGAFKVLGDIISTILKPIQWAFKQIEPLVSPVAKLFSDFIHELSFLDVIKAGGLLYIIQKLSNLSDMLEKFKETFKTVTKPLSLWSDPPPLFKAISKGVQAWSREKTANAIKQVALSLLILAGAIWVMSTIPQDKMIVALEGLAGSIVALSASFLLLQKLGTGDIKKNVSIILAMTGIAIALVAFTAAVKTLGTMKPKELLTGVVAAVSLITSFSVIIWALDKFTANGKTIQVKLLTLIGIALAVKMVAKSVESLGEMPWSQLSKGLIGAVGIIGALSMLAFALNTGTGSIKMGSALALGAVALAINKIAKAIALIGNLKTGEVIQGLTAVTIVMGMIAIIANLANKASGADFGVMAALAANIVVLKDALIGVASLPVGNVTTATLAIVSALGAMIGVVYLTQNMNGSIKGLLAMCLAMTTVGSTMKTLGGISWGGVVRGLTGLAGALLVLILAGAAASLPPISAGLIVLAGAITAIGLTVSAVVGSFALFIQALANFLNAWKDIGEFTMKYGKQAGKGIGDFVQSLGNQSEKIGSGVAKLVTGIFVGLAKGVAGSIKEIISIATNVITALSTAILANAGTIVKTIVQVFVTAVGQVAMAIPGLFVNIGTALIKGIEVLALFIRNNGQKIVKAFVKLFVAVLGYFKDMLTSLIRLIPGVGDGIADQMDKAFDGMADHIDKSLGDNLTVGTSKAITKAVQAIANKSPEMRKEAMNLAMSAQDGASKITQYLNVLGIDGADQFIEGVKSGSIGASEAGSILAQMAQDGASEGDLSEIAKALGATYQEGILTTADGTRVTIKGATVDTALEASDPSQVYDQLIANGGVVPTTYAQGIEWNTFKSILAAQGVSSATIDELGKQNGYDKGSLLSLTNANGIISNLQLNADQSKKIKDAVISELSKGSKQSNDEGSKTGKNFGDGVGSKNQHAKQNADAINSAVRTAMGNQSGILDAGAAIVNTFAKGISGAMDVAGKAISGVVDWVKQHLPHSPAKTGPLSGSGWNEVKTAGQAISTYFASGITSGIGAVTDASSQMVEEIQNGLGLITSLSSEDLEIKPTITPVFDTSNIFQSAFDNITGFGSVGATITYSGLNSDVLQAKIQDASLNSLNDILTRVNSKLDTLNNLNSTQADLLAQGMTINNYMDKDLVNKALAPGMQKAQTDYINKVNRRDGILPII